MKKLFMPPQSISEISECTKTSRQNVTQTLKRGMKKLYNSYSRNNPKLNPLEVVIDIAHMFSITTDKDYQCFFNDFPKEVKDEVIFYATKNSCVNLKNSIKGLEEKKNVEVDPTKKRRGRPPKIRVQ